MKLSAVRHHIRVLLVEDDAAQTQQLRSHLEENGYRPTVVTTGKVAQDYVDKESFQIAIVDLAVSDVPAEELVGHIRLAEQRNCIIVLTDSPSLQEATRLMRVGAGDYLAKPIARQDLVDSLDRACRLLGLIYTNEGELNRLIGQRIRTERLAQSLTLRQLSDRTDLTTSQLSQVELGKNAASIWALARISNSLGKQMSAMLEGL